MFFLSSALWLFFFGAAKNLKPIRKTPPLAAMTLLQTAHLLVGEWNGQEWILAYFLSSEEGAGLKYNFLFSEVNGKEGDTLVTIKMHQNLVDAAGELLDLDKQSPKEYACELRRAGTRYVLAVNPRSTEGYSSNCSGEVNISALTRDELIFQRNAEEVEMEEGVYRYVFKRAK